MLIGAEMFPRSPTEEREGSERAWKSLLGLSAVPPIVSVFLFEDSKGQLTLELDTIYINNKVISIFNPMSKETKSFTLAGS